MTGLLPSLDHPHYPTNPSATTGKHEAPSRRTRGFRLPHYFLFRTYPGMEEIPFGMLVSLPTLT